jgi:hypothetical protein
MENKLEKLPKCAYRTHVKGSLNSQIFENYAEWLSYVCSASPVSSFLTGWQQLWVRGVSVNDVQALTNRHTHIQWFTFMKKH